MKDGFGNELKVGDLVQVQLKQPLVFGRVAEVKEGGIIHGVRMKGGTEQVQPAVITIVCNHVIPVMPGELLGSVLAMREPDPPGEEIIEKAEADTRRANLKLAELD